MFAKCCPTPCILALFSFSCCFSCIGNESAFNHLDDRSVLDTVFLSFFKKKERKNVALFQCSLFSKLMDLGLLLCACAVFSQSYFRLLFQPAQDVVSSLAS